MPYYTAAFFEDGLTIEMVGEACQYIPCRSKTLAPANEWSLSWRLCRLNGLGSELTSFVFKLLHELLVTKSRLQQLTPKSSAICTHCNDQLPEDLQHALLFCSYNDGIGLALISALHSKIPDITPAAILRLELKDLPEDSELCTTIFLSTIFKEIWDKRLSKSRIRLYDIRATLEARCLLLRETRFRNQLATLSELTLKM